LGDAPDCLDSQIIPLGPTRYSNGDLEIYGGNSKATEKLINFEHHTLNLK